MDNGQCLFKFKFSDPSLENQLPALLASSPLSPDPIWWLSRGKPSWGPSRVDRGKFGRLLRLRLLVMQGGPFHVPQRGIVLPTPFLTYRSEHHLTAEQLESNRKYTDMLKQVLSTPYFYFSYNFDISHSRQRFDEQKSKEFLAR